jgi:recombination protein RecR
MNAIEGLTAEFAKMPGIGKRSAERLAYYVQSIPKTEARKLVDAIAQVKKRAKVCGECGNVSEEDPCRVCSAPSRDRTTICVVETPRDLGAIEAAGGYRGLYHVLGGRIAPLDNVYPENLNIRRLVERVHSGEIREVILATNPDTEGDATANHVADELAALDVTVTRLARGMPAGGQLEYAAQGTLAGALAGRQALNANRRQGLAEN